mmetsp:Transcript_12466/g.41343  ORF Transcript_12466/g.41343 Transcript_12466/m.41343 type:complete len:237 (-) Transcript_12466:4-714(-)
MQSSESALAPPATPCASVTTIWRCNYTRTCLVAPRAAQPRTRPLSSCTRRLSSSCARLPLRQPLRRLQLQPAPQPGAVAPVRGRGSRRRVRSRLSRGVRRSPKFSCGGLTTSRLRSTRCGPSSQRGACPSALLPQTRSSARVRGLAARAGWRRHCTCCERQTRWAPSTRDLPRSARCSAGARRTISTPPLTSATRCARRTRRPRSSTRCRQPSPTIPGWAGQCFEKVSIGSRWVPD